MREIDTREYKYLYSSKLIINIMTRKMKCPKCGYMWEPRKPYPKQCPYCKQYLRWN